MYCSGAHTLANLSFLHTMCHYSIRFSFILLSTTSLQGGFPFTVSCALYGTRYANVTIDGSGWAWPMLHGNELCPFMAHGHRSDSHTAAQRETAVTAYFSSKQLPLFVFAVAVLRWTVRGGGT